MPYFFILGRTGLLRLLLPALWYFDEQDHGGALKLLEVDERLQESQESQEYHELQEPQGPLESQESRESWEFQELQEPQEPQDTQDPQDPQGPQGPQGPQESQESQEPQRPQESQESQELEEPRELEEPQKLEEPQELEELREREESQEPLEHPQKSQASGTSGQKRQPSKPSTSLENPHPKRIRSQQLHSAAFYDTLSKVRLTRRALNELDRRTNQIKYLKAFTPPPEPSHSENLTKRLQKFAENGGPDLRDLRGVRLTLAYTITVFNIFVQYSLQPIKNWAKEMSSSLPQPMGSTDESADTPSRRSTAYDADFEQKLADNKIYITDYGRPEPINMEEIRQRLVRRRPSLDPSCFTNSDFRAFREADGRAKNEPEVMKNVFPLICGSTDILNKQNIIFTQLESMTKEVTVQAQPDFCDGARLETIKRRVREDLGKYVVPSAYKHYPAAPNLFSEAKGPRGITDVANRQIGYDGAHGARAMHKLQSYKQQSNFDNRAYTLGSTYVQGTLVIYAFHLSQADFGEIEYNMTMVGGWYLRGDPDTCRKGLTCFRNARDLAKEWRDELIASANQKA